jgi:hypothetical protein
MKSEERDLYIKRCIEMQEERIKWMFKHDYRKCEK